MMKRKVFYAFSILAVFASCAQDMNSEDFKKQSLQRDLAKLRLAEGVYTGPLLSSNTGKYLGALKVTMKAVTQNLGGQDTTKSGARPVLMAEYEFHGVGKASIKATDAHYDPDSGSYNTTVTVTHGAGASGGGAGGSGGAGRSGGAGAAGSSSGGSSQIFINGAIGGDGSFNGTIEATEGATGHQDYGGKFKLMRGGPSPEQLNKATKPSPDVFWDQLNYAGQMKFLIEDVITHRKSVRNTGLAITSSTSKSDEDFLSIFLPTKTVAGTINFGDGVRITFPGLLFDVDKGVLSGDTSIDMEFSSTNGTIRYTGTLRLACDRVPTPDGLGFDCTVSNATTPASKVLFSPTQDPVEPANQGDTKTEIRMYKGRGLFPNGLHAESKHWRDVTFSVSYLSRKRLEEIVNLFLPGKEKWVNVAFTFPDVIGVGVSFSSALYDIENRTLTATQDIQVGGVPARQTISCQNYVFADTEGPNKKPYRFKCLYMNTSNNIEIPLEIPAQR